MLHFSGHLRRAVTAAVATGAILGAGHVAAAQAAPTFSVTGTPLTSAVVGPAPTISLTKPGSPSVTLTCPALKPPGGLTFNSGTPAHGYWAGSSMSQNNCTGSNGYSYSVSISVPNQMFLNAAGSGFAVTATQSTTFTLSGGQYPMGNGVATNPAHSMVWTNGSGATRSTVSFTNYSLGTTGSAYFYHSGWTARITGQWSLATSGGGLITALP